MNKRINCPVCGARLIDEAAHTKSEVRTLSDKWHPDYLTKCRNCKKEIGIKQIMRT